MIARRYSSWPDLHADLTSGEVAAARGRLSAIARRRRKGGDWQYQAARDAERFNRDMNFEEQAAAFAHHYATLTADWFLLLWCLERVRAGRAVLATAEGRKTERGASGRRFRRAVPRKGSPLWLLNELIYPQLRHLDVECSWSRTAIEEGSGRWIDDSDSKEAFVALMGEFRQSQGDSNQPTEKCPYDWQDSLGSRDPISVSARIQEATLPQIRSLPDGFWAQVNEPVPSNMGTKASHGESAVHNIHARLSWKRSPEAIAAWANELQRIGLEVPNEFGGRATSGLPRP